MRKLAVKQKPAKHKIDKGEQLLLDLKRAINKAIKLGRRAAVLEEKQVILKLELKAIKARQDFEGGSISVGKAAELAGLTVAELQRRNAPETAARQEDVAHQKELREEFNVPDEGEEMEFKGGKL